MSVQELQARIDDISADIDRQKEMLKKLEHLWSTVKAPSSASSTPSAAQCRPGAREIPMLFLNVCSTWTDIALSTPALWEAIQIQFPRAKAFGQLLATWLSRARNRFLSLALHGTFDEGAATIVRGYAEKLRSVEIHSDDDDCLDLFESMSCPSLETLKIGFLCNAHGDTPCYSLSQTLEILRVAPNLVECAFYNLSTFDNSTTGHLVLPTLRSLAFSHEKGYGDDEILRLLTLPALETLSLAMVNVSLRMSPPS
ncbi:hypothetical protein B0H17DRAFT_1206115 [Mycena rosella]|uniref:F-box domain-containing protein n=1 Tax=Mycena rosella TaxID=1033263 RepID=A0AAD7D5N8_MYCRO|nr:hypothetical protein B0H17DRAFT_1206115 [Mycena rosella]